MKKDSKKGKKDSKKKKGSKKKSKKATKSVSPELALLQELNDTVKSMSDELETLKEINKSLKSDIKKIKKKDKKKKEKAPEVVTKVMEPQVLPPEKNKVKRTRKAAAPKAKATTESKAAPVAKTIKGKPDPKPKTSKTGKKPGPKPRTGSTAKKAVSPGRPAGPEDLKFIQGLGAKIETLLNEQGVKTFSDLAKASQTSVKSVLEKSGPRFKNQDPKPLIEQAKLVKAEKWSDLESLQAELMKGKKKPGPKAGK